MFTSVSKSQFRDAFHAYDRYDQFGYDALGIIFDYLEELEEGSGEPIELDVIAICCDYSVDDVATIAQYYSVDIDGLDEDEAREAVVDYLNENTCILGECDDGQIVYCSSF
jgi:hypothetical protein